MNNVQISQFFCLGEGEWKIFQIGKACFFLFLTQNLVKDMTAFPFLQKLYYLLRNILDQVLVFDLSLDFFQLGRVLNRTSYISSCRLLNFLNITWTTNFF